MGEHWVGPSLLWSSNSHASDFMSQPVVHKAATSERLRKDTLLFSSRVEPILVCPLCFAHWFTPFTNIGISYHICRYTNIRDRGKENEHSFIRKETPVPKPQKRNAASIPKALAGGFTQRVDNDITASDWVRSCSVFFM